MEKQRSEIAMSLSLYCCDVLLVKLSIIFLHCCVLPIYYANAKVELDSSVQILSQVILRLGEGDGGDITINTDRLSMDGFSQIQSDTQQDGNGGSIIIEASDISLTDQSFINSGTGILGEGVEGNAGSIEIATNTLSLANTSAIEAFTSGAGNAGDVVIEAREAIILEDASAITSDVRNEGQGAGGNIFLSTPSLSLSNGSRLSTSTFEQGIGEAGSINADVSGAINITDGAFVQALTENDASGGNIIFQARTINLAGGGEIFAETEGAGNAGNINLEIMEDLTLRTNSVISARAFEDANGGNVSIDARYIIAFPSTVNGNDIIANAEGGNGGNIILNAESLLGIQEGIATPGNETNELDASSEFSIDGSVIIETPDLNPLQGTRSFSSNFVAVEEITSRVCAKNTDNIARNTFTIKGKGGLIPGPGLPLNSLNLHSETKTIPTSTIPQPIKTSQGKIQPARGVKVTESGEVTLTTYLTNNSGDRLPEGSINCSRV